MSIKISDIGIYIKLNSNSKFGSVYEIFLKHFNYKKHRYVHIVYSGNFLEEIYLFTEKIKANSVFIIFEPLIIDNVENLKRLYAKGVDIIIVDALKNVNIKYLREHLPEDILLIKEKKEEEFLAYEKLIKRYPFLIENSFFEPIKRKIWIDLTNLRRKLRVKEIGESYTSSGI